MRKIFFWLLAKYSKSEKDRLLVLEELWKGVLTNYTEQSMPGNLHNFQIEVVMSSPWVRYVVNTMDDRTEEIIIANFNSGTLAGIGFLVNNHTKEANEVTKSISKFHHIKK